MTDGQSAITKYGPVRQPVSKYLWPPHAPDADAADRYILSREQRDSLYEYIRCEYLSRSRGSYVVGRDLTMVELAWGSGFRISELTHLQSKGADRDIDYVHNRIRTRWGKGAKCRGKKTRWSMLTPRARVVLQGYEEHIRPAFPQAESRPELFLSPTGGPLSYQECWMRLAEIVKAARQAGVSLPSRVRWHDLRRTFATLFLEDNPDQFWLLMKLMGHSARGTMSSYVLIDEDTFQYTLSRTHWAPRRRELPRRCGGRGLSHRARRHRPAPGAARQWRERALPGKPVAARGLGVARLRPAPADEHHRVARQALGISDPAHDDPDR